jgi:hypothetical protein
VPLSLYQATPGNEAGRHRRRATDTADLAEKAICQLGRIELTYDRLFASYGSNELPHEQKAMINISQVIDYILAESFASNCPTVKWSDRREPTVPAASHRVLFVLNRCSVTS